MRDVHVGDIVMTRAILTSVLCSSAILISANSAFSESLGRYECTIVGPALPEPVGDQTGHAIQSFQYSCVGIDGLIKEAVLTGNTVLEWKGQQATFLSASTTHRASGGLAVGQLLEGTGSSVLKEGKVAGLNASGTATIKFAIGSLSSLSGKMLKWVSKSIGFNRFEQEYSLD